MDEQVAGVAGELVEGCSDEYGGWGLMGGVT